MKSAAERPSEPLYRIGAVARATGIGADTLRVWERRYGGASPARSPRGGRLYTDADIARLRTIKQLLDRGHAIGQLAGLPADELGRILVRHDGAQPGDDGADWTAARTAFVDAIVREDLGAAQQILGRAAVTLPARALVVDLVAPLLREVGDRWAEGRLRIAHEHAATGLVRSTLGALLGTYAPLPGAPTLIAATLAGELHELGALLVAVLAAATGWRVIYLGANLPRAEIAAAAARAGANLVALSMVGPETPSTLAEMRRLARELPPAVTLVAGGAGLGKSAGGGRPPSPQFETFDRLDAFPEWLDRQRRRIDGR